MELWILASLIAASLQTVRFMLQKILSSGQLSTAGATFAGFCYSAPLFWIAVAGYFWVNDLAPPQLSMAFWEQIFFAIFPYPSITANLECGFVEPSAAVIPWNSQN